MNDVVSKAKLAEELNLSRARISQLCKSGLPVRPDGKLNRAEAVAWVKGNVCSWLGGWELRKKPRGGISVPAAVVELPELGGLANLEIPDWEAEIRESAVIDFMNEVRRTENIESFARAAIRFGCTMKEAFAVARLFDTFLAFNFVPRDPERKHIRVCDEPDWKRMAADAGTTADVEAWQDWMNRLLEEVGPGKAEG